MKDLKMPEKRNEKVKEKDQENNQKREEKDKKNKLTTNLMPVIFIGHGSPMNAIENTGFTEGWREIAKRISKYTTLPKLILCISAHWESEGTKVTAMETPKTIHDFYGFPKELYNMEYPANGSPKLAKEIIARIKRVEVTPDYDWGLDHGTWSVLHVMYPNADIPVMQLSINEDLPPEAHFALGEELNQFRREEVLIIGSGNIVHNLMRLSPGGNAQKWATEFNEFARKNIKAKNYKALIEYQKEPTAKLANPTSEHYIPLLYTLGATKYEDAIFFNEKIDYGTLSMRCVVWGLKN